MNRKESFMSIKPTDLKHDIMAVTFEITEKSMYIKDPILFKEIMSDINKVSEDVLHSDVSFVIIYKRMCDILHKTNEILKVQ